MCGVLHIQKITGVFMGLPLVTRAEYKAYAGITSTTSDTKLDSLILQTSELVKSICRRTFVDWVDDTKVEIQEGGGPLIILQESPVIAINSVELSTDYGKTYTTLVEYTNYVLDLKAGALRPIQMTQYPLEVYGSAPYGTINYGFTPYGTTVNPIFPKAINGYRISYTAGYEELPADLKLAVFDLVTYYQRNDGAVHSNNAPTGSGIQIQYITDTSLPAHIRRVLDLYTTSYD